MTIQFAVGLLSATLINVVERNSGRAKLRKSTTAAEIVTNAGGIVVTNVISGTFITHLINEHFCYVAESSFER